MARLWKRVDGEPYMINPRLGVLALQALNPPERRKTMAKKNSKAHMAWVRSFRKNSGRRRRKSYRRNPYPLAGAVTALGNPHHKRHRRYKRNPGIFASARSHLTGAGSLGLPPLMPVVYGGGGFIATAMVQGFLDTLVPASMGGQTGNPTGMVKYAEIAVSIIAVRYAAKLISPAAASMAAVGGGIFAIQQAAHDFAPGVIPGMHAYTPLKAYTPVRNSGTMGRGLALRASVASAGGAMPQLARQAGTWGMPQLAAQDIGGTGLPVGFADSGAMDMVPQRFRRFN